MDGGDLSAGQLGSLETQAANGLQQGIGQRGEQQAELVGPPEVGRGAVRKQL